MRASSRQSFLILVLSLLVAGSDSLIAQTKQPSTTKTPQQKSPPTHTAQSDAEDEDEPNDEIDTAAVKIDLSQSSPLIQKLYQATRPTKESDILASLTEAKQILANGADVKATDQYGRTALHLDRLRLQLQHKARHRGLL